MKKIALSSLLVTVFSLSAFADKIVLLDNPKDSLQARADYIQIAQETIRAQYFTVENDEVSKTALALLLEATRKNPNLKVKILIDSMHNLLLNRTMAAVMGNISSLPTNIEIKEYNQFNLFRFTRYTKRMHDKALIVDGKYLISGGRNIANGYYGAAGNKKGSKALPVFEDSDALLLESAAIDEATRYFDDLWSSKFVNKVQLFDYDKDELSADYCNSFRARHEDTFQCESSRKYRVKRVQKELDHLNGLAKAYTENQLRVKHDIADWASKAIEVENVNYLFDEVRGQKSNLKKPENNIGVQLYNAISKANSSVVIVTPYTVITPEQEALFKSLQARNIEVTLITNSKGSNDVPAAHVGYEKTRQKAIDAGVKIFEYQGPDTLHAKMVLIDRTTLFIGSFNWDFRSQNLNREVGILAELPNDKENNLSINVVRKFAKILKKSCPLGGEICNPTLRTESLEDLTEQELNDLIAAFKLREQKTGALYRILYPLIEKQL